MKKEQLSEIFQTLDSSTMLQFFLILLAAALLILSTQKIVPWLANKLHGRHRLVLLAMIPLLRLIIIVVAFLLCVPLIIEPSLQNMIALLGSLGLALGFALKEYASSLIAGVVVVSENPYRTGDWVEINGIYGEVVHVGMRSLRLVTPDDNLVTIPHLKFWNDPIINANNGSPQLQCVVHFYLQPEHDGRQVRTLLEDVAWSSPYLHLNYPIAVIVEEKPWGTHYRLKAYPVEADQQFRFITDLTIRGREALTVLGMSALQTPALMTDPVS